MKKPIAVILLGILLSACATTPVASTSEDSRSPEFVNKLWQVTESSDIPSGSLYIFLSDGALIIASDTGTPLVGRWSATGTAITMIEESLPYQGKIVASTENGLELRMKNPGGEISLFFRRINAP